MRSLAGQSSATWTNPTLTAQSSVISADDVRDLRNRLNDALVALNIQTSAYTDNTIVSYADDPLNATTVKAVHIRELRTRATSGAGNSTSGGSSGGLKYVLSDLQGTTPAVMNNNGSSSAIVARHDYLPFGEELSSVIGLRSSSQGYAATDTNRFKYGLTERDASTGLDHTWFRKYENLSGRLTTPDPYSGSMSIGDPQSFNRFTYTGNDPVNFSDPSGLCTFNINIFNNAGLSQHQQQILRNEISRIFGTAGQSVAFNNFMAADVAAGSYNLTIQRAGNPSLIQQGIDAPGWTPTNRAIGLPGNAGFASTGVLASVIQSGLTSNAGLQAMGRHPDNLAVGLGRVGSHEAAHFFLAMLGHSSQGLMQASFRES